MDRSEFEFGRPNPASVENEVLLAQNQGSQNGRGHVYVMD
jgi:hypothetical protein